MKNEIKKITLINLQLLAVYLISLLPFGNFPLLFIIIAIIHIGTLWLISLISFFKKDRHFGVATLIASLSIFLLVGISTAIILENM